MKGKSQQRALFLQIGRALTQSKPKTRKQAYSLAQGINQTTRLATPSTELHIYQNPLTAKRKITAPYPININTNALVSGMNDQFLYMRKQNHLNTCFNVRKNKLKQISKENKQMHKRLNSQKSIYSSIDFNKSFQSNTQIKKRLSQSKLSNRLNSSRSSERGGINLGKNKIQQKKKDNIKIKASNINQAKKNQLKSFQGLFREKPELNQKGRLTQKSAFNTIKKSNDFANLGGQSYRKTVPAIMKHNSTELPEQMGNILHRIAEVMYSGEEQVQPKPSKGYMKPKKGLVF